MILIQDVPNSRTPDTDYPFGGILNRDGTTPGTGINEATLADMIQAKECFASVASALVAGAVTPNGESDNATNGQQVFTGMINVIADGLPNNPAGAWVASDLSYSITGSGTLTSFTATYAKYKWVGKTLFYQAQLILDVAGGGVTGLVLIPGDAFWSEVLWANLGGVYPYANIHSGSVTILGATLLSGGGHPDILLGNFSSGVHYTNIQIVAEVA
jgi:hypothetical protein